MEEDTIELIDFLKVIGKRKSIIISGTFLCIAIVLILSFILPKTYKVYTVMEIGKADRDGEKKVLEDPKVVISKIKRVYIYKAMDELNIPEKKLPELKVEGSNAVIDISANVKDVNLALNVFEKINTLLLNDHKKYKEKAQVVLNNDLNNIDLKINTEKSANKALLQKLSLLKGNRKNIQERIKKTKKRLEERIAERNNLNNSSNPNNQLSIMVYSNEIKERQQYYNQLQDKLRFDIADREVDILNEIEGKKEILKTLELEKQNLRSELDYLNKTSTKIIKEPNYLKIPVKPKKILYITIAGIVGLIFSLFLAFFLEYLGKVKTREETRGKI